MLSFRCCNKNLYSFTLIELLVSTAISSWHFVTQKSAVATQQRIPLFLKEKGGAGERENFFPARSAGCEKTRPSVFVSLRRDESLRWGSDISSQSIPLFLKEKGGAGEREPSALVRNDSLAPLFTEGGGGALIVLTELPGKKHRTGKSAL